MQKFLTDLENVSLLVKQSHAKESLEEAIKEAMTLFDNREIEGEDKGYEGACFNTLGHFLNLMPSTGNLHDIKWGVFYHLKGIKLALQSQK